MKFPRTSAEYYAHRKIEILRNAQKYQRDV